MRLVTSAVLAALLVVVGSVPAQAEGGPTTSVGSFTVWNPCTQEDVAVTATYRYLAWRHGDVTHAADGTGVGLTTGASYRYVWQFFETSTQYEGREHLISQGSGSDMTRLIDYSVVDGEVVTCS